jgi:hypothetical protein
MDVERRSRCPHRTHRDEATINGALDRKKIEIEKAAELRTIEFLFG